MRIKLPQQLNNVQSDFLKYTAQQIKFYLKKQMIRYWILVVLIIMTARI